MNDDNILGGVLNQLGQTAKKAVQQVVKLPAASAEGSGPLRSEASEPKEEKKQQWQSDEERVKFLKGLYGKSDASQDESLRVNKNANPSDKSAEEQKNLLELRQQLHKEVYYDPTFNPVKKQEERPAERVENEKKQEMQDLQQKEAQKPPPLAIQRAAQRVENLPGAG